MDVLDVLHDDHPNVKKLFLPAQRSGQSDQSRPFQQIRQELESMPERRKIFSIPQWKR